MRLVCVEGGSLTEAHVRMRDLHPMPPGECGIDEGGSGISPGGR